MLNSNETLSPLWVFPAIIHIHNISVVSCISCVREDLLTAVILSLDLQLTMALSMFNVCMYLVKYNNKNNFKNHISIYLLQKKEHHNVMYLQCSHFICYLSSEGKWIWVWLISHVIWMSYSPPIKIKLKQRNLTVIFLSTLRDTQPFNFSRISKKKIQT